ncbi:MAG: hypothetical protein K6F32_07700 [Bacilli bacterium]|nr:hypothetical protein [Bacilli bacterium]
MTLLTYLDASTLRSFFINPWVNGLILGILVLGIFISFRVLNIADLSVEGILPLITMLTAVLIDADVNPWLVMLISIAIGAVCGVLNALLTIYLKTPPLLSGIIVMALTFGLAIMINSLKAGQASFDPSAHLTVFNWLKNILAGWGKDRVWLFYASYLSYIIVTLVLLAVCAFALYFFFGTELGMAIRASGKNAHMSRANGINVERMSIIALAISGGLIGLAACLYGQHNGMGLPTDGQGMIVIALSSLFLGEMIFGHKSFKLNLIATMVGSLLYWYLIQVLMLIDVHGYMLSVYKALLLVAVIALQLLITYIKNKHTSSPNRRKPEAAGEGEPPKQDAVSELKQSIVKHCLGEVTSC